MSLSEARFGSIWNGQTAIAQKVYESVPKQDTWSTQEIIGDLTRRQLGVAKDQVQGVLASLRDSGLIKESRDGWTQVAVRRKQQPIKLRSIATTPPEPEETAMAGPIEKLDKLATDARKLADQMRQLADAIDEAALEAEEQVSRSGAEAETLRQLRKLLQGPER